MQRASGILLHPTSFAGDYPVGEFGEEAIRFIDFLARAGQSVWQVLPLGPTGYGHSPYNALSAFAGNPALIDPQQLIAHGDLDQATLSKVISRFSELSFYATHEFKQELLRHAGEAFLLRASRARRDRYRYFCENQKTWLDDFSLFMALKGHFEDRCWNEWPLEVRTRNPEALASYRNLLKHDCDLISYQQFIFSEQWLRLKDYANQRGIKIFGDIPIFVAYDSADVWANQHLFQLDDYGKATAVAGVPPDYFSRTGQRWGNPLYKWEEHIAEDFNWWLCRFRHQFENCDMVRIDHFRGFQACWSIPAQERTAVNGHWEETSGRQLLAKLQQQFHDLPIVAEDLGTITPDVERLRDDFNLPGMKILQFAFDSDARNPYLPENHVENCVIYTGTHDNNTTLGWWQNLSKARKDVIRNYLDNNHPDMPWAMIRLAMSSCASLCIIPLQDILSLDGKGRLNTPGQAGGNWQWQMSAAMLDEKLAIDLYRLTKNYGRLVPR